MDLVKGIYRPLTTLVARRVLAGRQRARREPERGRLTRQDVDRFLREAWRKYDEEVGGLPVQPTLGSTMNVRLACFTLSFLDALLAEGIERGYAIEFIADAAWAIYQRWARVAVSAARFKPGRSALGFATQTGGRRTSLRFPFNAPGYVIETVPVRLGVAFDVVLCPVATYFREHGAVDLCLAAWCNLDYALGEMTGQKLIRTTTLVQGAGRCDFRILPDGTPKHP